MMFMEYYQYHMRNAVNSILSVPYAVNKAKDRIRTVISIAINVIKK